MFETNEREECPDPTKTFKCQEFMKTCVKLDFCFCMSWWKKKKKEQWSAGKSVSKNIDCGKQWQNKYFVLI